VASKKKRSTKRAKRAHGSPGGRVIRKEVKVVRISHLISLTVMPKAL
jgi:hypothetical protein